MKYEFPYSDYLASNSYINGLIMMWLWEDENVGQSGIHRDDINKFFPEVENLIEDLVEYDEFPKSAIDSFEEVDSVLPSLTAGELWISFASKPKKGEANVFKNRFTMMISMEKGDKEPSFKLRKN